MKSRALFIVILLLSLFSGCQSPLIYDLNEKTGAPIPFQKIPDGLASLSAKDCGDCHEAIYNEWQESMHSKAFTDPFFQAYWRKDGYEWSCLTCHTPLENQLEKTVSFKKGGRSIRRAKNPRFNSDLQQEGITCAVCHVRKGVVYGPYKKKSLNAPHAVAFDSRFLSEEICLTCHEVPAKKFSFLKSGICSTGNEWNNGPYKKDGYICQTCHMPAISRPLVEEFPSMNGRRHLWKGGSKPEQVKKALTVALSKPERNRVKIDLINSGAGHYFPTGDPDRKVFVTVKIMNKSGEIVKEKQVTFERVILWKPIMIELWDSRLPPRGKKTFFMNIPREGEKIAVKAVYQILSERARKKLEKKYGLKDYPPVRYTFYQKEFILTEL